MNEEFNLIAQKKTEFGQAIVLEYVDRRKF